MRTISPAIANAMASGSFIRKMFEKGIELRQEFGADAVFDFSLGNPDVPPPASLRSALSEIAEQAVKPHGVGYCPNVGEATPRAVLADYLSRQQKVKVEADHVVMTVGAAGALVCFFRAVIEPGDEVITPAPYFVEYGAYCGHFGGVLKAVPSVKPTFAPDVEGIARAITPRTRAIILNSPNNPTGCIYSKDDLRKIGALVNQVNQERGEGGRPLFILSDEPYRAFAYDDAVVPPMLPISPWTCVLGSFSKTLSLAGERIGYFCANPELPGVKDLIAAVAMTNRTLGFVNAPVFGQRLVAKLIAETVDLSIYARRRQKMIKVLSDAGLEFANPQGAFYIFAKSPVEDDAEFVEALLQENILVVPGKGFGCSGYVRLCYAVEDSVIERSAEGFKRAVRKLLGK